MLKEPPLKSYTIHGSPVRDIPILPDRISPDPEGWLCEYWCRMDSRIQYKRDIEPRIRPDLRPKYPTRFSHSRLRFRQDCYLLGWIVKRNNFVRERNEIIKAATEAGIDVEATNSTRGLSWGFVDPTKGEAGGCIPVPKSLRPKNTREDAPSARNILCAPGCNRVSLEASSPRVLRQTPAMRAQMRIPQPIPIPDYSQQELPPPEQAISFGQYSSLSTSRSNEHAHSKANPVQVLKAQKNSRQAILPKPLSSSEQSIRTAQPCLAKQSGMLPADFSTAQDQPFQPKNSQRSDAVYQAWNTFPANCRKHESSLQDPATAGLYGRTIIIKNPVQTTAATVRHQQSHPFYLGDSASGEFAETQSNKSTYQPNKSNASNVCEGDARAPGAFIQVANSICDPVADEPSHFKASDVYEGYARSNEEFSQNENGTYVPILLKNISPRTSQRYPSVSASVYRRMTQARAHQAPEKVENM
jgi:hypothetical protein